MKMYALLNTDDGVVDGVVNCPTTGGFLFNSKDEAIDYIYEESLNPLTTLILEVTKVLEPTLYYKKIAKEDYYGD